MEIRRDEEILALAQAVNAVRTLGATRIRLTVPYLPHARMDRLIKTDNAGFKVCSLEVLGDFLNNLYFDAVVAWDVHSNEAGDMGNTGFGHLTSSLGSDSLAAVGFAEDYYGMKNEFIAASVPATEHSVMCMSGMEDEIGTFRRLITELYPKGIVSVVSDTWDFWRVITEYMPELKDEIMSREPDSMGFAKLVIRPDSGDPADIICGTAHAVKELSEINEGNFKFDEGKPRYFVCNDTYYEVIEVRGKHQYNLQMFTVEATPEMKGAIQCMYETFGGTETDKGYRMLDSHIGLIYGDSITMSRAIDIFSRLMAKGFASSNVVLGVGSFSYQYVTRDTFGMAMKATYGVVDGVGREIFKAPKTDDGTKHSAKGLMRIDLVGGEYVMTDQVSEEDEAGGELKVVFEDGLYYNTVTLNDIRSLTMA